VRLRGSYRVGRVRCGHPQVLGSNKGWESDFVADRPKPRDVVPIAAAPGGEQNANKKFTMAKSINIELSGKSYTLPPLQLHQVKSIHRRLHYGNTSRPG
jgi:hypothetical protein